MSLVAQDALRFNEHINNSNDHLHLVSSEITYNKKKKFCVTHRVLGRSRAAKLDGLVGVEADEIKVFAA